MTQPKKKTIKHNYTSELELKSLLIRIKNTREGKGTEKYNTKINKYIIWHTKINNKKYDTPAKRNITKAKLKEKIVLLSEECSCNADSYERFGVIILLMIENILKKPQFSGYTYRDDFYSDAVYKILKYLHNFNHKLVSKITGTPVNAFAYISQIIHNSILFIINTKKKDLDNIKKQIGIENLNHNLQIKGAEYVNQHHYHENQEETEDSQIIEDVYLNTIKNNLVEEIINLNTCEDLEYVTRLNVHYPHNYSITFDEYNELKNHLKGRISIIRMTEDSIEEDDKSGDKDE